MKVRVFQRCGEIVRVSTKEYEELDGWKVEIEHGASKLEITAQDLDDFTIKTKEHFLWLRKERL